MNYILCGKERGKEMEPTSLILAGCSGLIVAIGGALIKTWRDTHQHGKDIKQIQETDKEQWVEIKEIVSANRESILSMAKQVEVDKLENEFREHIKESAEIRRELGEMKSNIDNQKEWLQSILEYNKKIDDKFDKMIEYERNNR